MSNRNKILLGFGVLVIASIVFQYLLPESFRVEQPHVSVAAEPVFHVGGESGFGLGHAEDALFEINNSMIMAAIVVIFLIAVAAIVRATASLYPKGFYNFMELIVDTLYNTFGAVDRRYIARFFPMVGAVFFYVLASNWLALIPGVLSIGYYEGGEGEARVVTDALAFAGSSDQRSPADDVLAQEGGEGDETEASEGEEAQGAETILVPYLRSPSADLNNTIMLAVVAFFYVQFWGVRELGGSYFVKFLPLGEFKNGIGAGLIAVFVGLVEIVSELARVVSFAFRLFGNVFAGEVILLVMVFLLPVLQLPFLALEMFIGFIQAFVFAILIMVFASLATTSHHHDEGHEGTHGVQYADDVPGDLGGATHANPAAH